MPIDPVQLAADLIRFPSVTPEDAGAQAYLRKILTEQGFACTDLSFAGIKNLFTRVGDTGPHFCFCGHTDVVPPGDAAAWTHPPFAGEVADGNLYGRGAVDMKGNIAAFIAAAASFLEAHRNFKGSLSLLITGDEEGLAINGTVKVLNWMNKNDCLADAYLVGEPSNPERLGDEIKIGRRGSLTGTLHVRGVQGHVAYPHLADNPLPRLVKLLGALQSRVFDAGSAHFPATNFEITTIDTGNAAGNIIPALATAKFNIRFNDRWNAGTLEAELRRTLDGCDTPYNLTCISNAESFVTRTGVFTAQMSQAVEEVTGRKPALTTGGGTSDARFIAPYGPVVEFGLINRTMHKVDEYAAVEDVQQLMKIYARMLEIYFGV